MRNVETMIGIIGTYFGGNPLLLLCIAGFIVLWKNVSKKNRIYMSVICVCAAVFVYNDIMYKLAQVIGEETSFYRVLWMVPVIGLSAYLCMEVYESLKHGIQRGAMILIAVVMLFLYGSNSISNWTELPENIYQIPSEVVAVADIIEADSGGARVNFCDEEDELSNLIRQYNANICLPVEHTSYLNYLWEDNAIDVSGRQIRNIVRNSQVDYLAIKAERIGSQRVLETSGCREIGRTAEHVVYATDATWWAEYEAKEQAAGLVDEYITSFENVNVPGMSGMVQFLYLNPAHVQEESHVKEWAERVADFEVEGVFVGNHLDGESEAETFQMLEYEAFIIVSLDNRKESLSKELLAKYDEAQALGKPMILMLRTPLNSADSEDELLKRVLAEDSTVLQVFATDAENYKKELLSEELVQCSGFTSWIDTTETMIIIRGL